MLLCSELIWGHLTTLQVTVVLYCSFNSHPQTPPPTPDPASGPWITRKGVAFGSDYVELLCKKQDYWAS